DMATGKDPVLYIDEAGTGQLTDASKVEWTGRPEGKAGYKLMMGSAKVDIDIAGKATPCSIGIYKFDANDPERAQLKDTVLVYADYGFEGTAKFGSASHRILLIDANFSGFKEAGDFVAIDRDDDGKIRGQAETYRSGKPFNIGGQTMTLGAVDFQT